MPRGKPPEGERGRIEVSSWKFGQKTGRKVGCNGREDIQVKAGRRHRLILCPGLFNAWQHESDRDRYGQDRRQNARTAPHQQSRDPTGFECARGAFEPNVAKNIRGKGARQWRGLVLPEFRQQVIEIAVIHVRYNENLSEIPRK